MPICNVCRDCLEGIWDPSKTKRVCTFDEWEKYDRGRFRKPPNILEPAVPEVSGELGDSTSEDMERSDIPEEPLESEESEESQDNTPERTEQLHMPEKADELEKSEASEDGTSEDAERSNMPENFLLGHHASKESFLQAVNQKCLLCSQVYYSQHGERTEHDPMILELGYYTLFTVIRKPKSGVPACIYHLYALLDFCFYIVPHVSSMNLNLDIGSNTGDEVTWDIIRGWLDECLEKHTRCNQKNITDYVPSRLVKLNDTTGEPTFCVVEKCQVDPQSPYLTLSHRWGESSQLRLKLTRSTSERLSREQLCRTLPKTFRDASEVARRLKICYLWIDSLCIFQDSAEDWLKESSSMRDVYGNAFLNIAALGAEDNHGGLFFSRNPSELKPTIFNFSVDGPEDPHLYRFDHDTGSASWVGPILQRGWVLQERILSRRVLYFGSRQVFWECYEITCSETHPKNFNQYVYNKYDEKEQGQTRTEPNHHAWKALMGTDRLQPSCEDKLSQLFMDWYEIARTYTTCDLTVSSDKLVALSGIAKDMKRRLTTLGCRDTKYLAGMWSQDLPYALMWSLNEFGRRPESYRAPSWSWAAVDGSSLMPFYGRTDLEALVSVTSARTTLENDEDETGKVRGGMLTLTGFLATANIGLSAENTYEQESNRRRIIDFRNHEDGTRLPKFNDYHYIFCSSACVLFDTKEIYPRVLCLPITRGDRPAKFDLIWGLALVQVGHENYRRVGLFSLHVNPGDSVQSIFTNASQGSVNII